MNIFFLTMKKFNIANIKLNQFEKLFFQPYELKGDVFTEIRKK